LSTAPPIASRGFAPSPRTSQIDQWEPALRSNAIVAASGDHAGFTL